VIDELKIQSCPIEVMNKGKKTKKIKGFKVRKVNGWINDGSETEKEESLENADKVIMDPNLQNQILFEATPGALATL
jgi:hypothetical protein